VLGPDTTSCVLGSYPAVSHPHVWITAHADVVFNNAGVIIAVKNSWTLDEAYSAVASEGLDTNNDGNYSPEELAPLTQENIASLREFEYFTYVYRNGEKVPLAPPTEASQNMAGKNLQLHFQVPLLSPIDPKKQAFTYKVYDPTFYIAVDLDEKNPVAIHGVAPPNCLPKIDEPKQSEDLASTQQMLADKPQDWQPPVEENFGVLFAKTVSVLCK
jgi:ABC-type uncharacterized transport system substrate-binding protein